MLATILALWPADSFTDEAASARLEDGAYFLVGFPTEEVTFTLYLTDATRIVEARRILANGQADHYIFGGIIIPSPAPYNPPWSYHVDSATVSFFRTATEVCDAHPQAVQDHLDEVGGEFLPGSYWCPWLSRLLRELPAPLEPLPYRLFLPLIQNG
jgi:hypothetical protein